MVALRDRSAHSHRLDESGEAARRARPDSVVGPEDDAEWTRDVRQPLKELHLDEERQILEHPADRLVPLRLRGRTAQQPARRRRTVASGDGQRKPRKLRLPTHEFAVHGDFRDLVTIVGSVSVEGQRNVVRAVDNELGASPRQRLHDLRRRDVLQLSRRAVEAVTAGGRMQFQQPVLHEVARERAHRDRIDAEFAHQRAAADCQRLDRLLPAGARDEAPRALAKPCRE